MTNSETNLAEVFSEYFTDPLVIGRKYRNASYGEIGMSGFMYVGRGVISAQNNWRYQKMGFSVPCIGPIVASFPEIGVLSNESGNKYALLADVPLWSKMHLWTDEEISFNTPALLSVVLAGGHDCIKATAYIGDRQVGEEMVPPLGGERKKFNTLIESDKEEYRKEMKGKIGFNFEDAGPLLRRHHVGVYGALYSVRLIGTV